MRLYRGGMEVQGQEKDDEEKGCSDEALTLRPIFHQWHDKHAYLIAGG
jgi:hypothetical protein